MILTNRGTSTWVVCRVVLRQHEPCVADAVPGAPDRGQAHAAPDRQVAEGGRARRGSSADGRTGHTPGRGDLAALGEHLPALRLRSLGAALAAALSLGRRDRGAV